MESDQISPSESTGRSFGQNFDSGLMCFVTTVRLLGIPADYQQLKRAFVVSGTKL